LDVLIRSYSFATLRYHSASFVRVIAGYAFHPRENGSTVRHITNSRAR
jgi:hypothetical protein